MTLAEALAVLAKMTPEQIMDGLRARGCVLVPLPNGWTQIIPPEEEES